MHTIEEARRGDAPAIAAVLVASIRELCGEDHHHDPARIAAWTGNKTRETVLRWILDPEFCVLVSRAGGDVAREGGETAGVGMVRGDEILLNYVAPAHRFAGHGKALLAAMEARIHAAGYTAARLTSTRTAHRFYEGHGWHETGPPKVEDGLAGQPMAKRLAPPDPAHPREIEVGD
ncbi:GNAT family N-acetyltransferase [Acuticoccus sp. I52.16.1]|uniref:GNAT family N-acetyltransferase n=1 Tax=Acuticoccus sp. I52.16.1 TaxID=2928472 RepID=UPI001FD5BF70|nr:GNAT family N-acetyltransferase [Acuticoccus sp. I52.16.1]UOM34826.1 GNAT family N-acetyltransferase [Acuticoccus sp. I52.16.1]